MTFDPTFFVPSPRRPLRMAAHLGQPDASSFPTRPTRPTLEEVRALYGPARSLGKHMEDHRLAMDAALEECGVYDLIQHSLDMGHAVGAGSTGFLGYPFLTRLTQDALIRAGVETVADEMTRKWVALTGANAEDDAHIKTLTEDMQSFDLQKVFNRAAALTHYFGGCLVYMDIGPLSPEAALAPLHLDASTFAQGALRRFTVIEPINIYPGRYNAADPLAADYFCPETWLIQGREYHKSRFLHFSSGDMPVLLRPAYNFFGMPMAQLALDYVGHFTQSREAAARLLTKFSLTAFKTNLSDVLQGGSSANLDMRMAYFLQKQSNDGAFVIDKEDEDLIKIDTSLAGVIDIVRQALELLAAVFRVPAVKLLGISPAGFNATGEGDLRNYYDHVASQQQKVLRQPLNRALDVLQYNAFGFVDQRVSADFATPGDTDPKQVAELNKLRADTDAVLVSMGAVSTEEVRTRLAACADSGYSGIDVDNVPEMPGAGLEAGPEGGAW